MNLDVKEYLKNDRQWLRQQRLDHAKYQLRKATDPKEKSFWKQVIDANRELS